jgi:hypothetical protein
VGSLSCCPLLLGGAALLWTSRVYLSCITAWDGCSMLEAIDGEG